MPEHRIKLRGGWDWLDAASPPGLARKVSLPTDWGPGIVGPIRLVRKFGRPPIDPVAESVWLELGGVPGLRSLRLNGAELAPPPPGVFEWAVPIGRLLEDRNTLILEVDLGQVPPKAWGSIALLIGPGLEQEGLG